jgi:hypothetical protein
MEEEFNELIGMKRSRKKPQAGDIFVIQPLPGRYLYGKVIRTNLPNEDPFIKGWNLIYIYKNMVSEPVVPVERLDPEQLLMFPTIVNNQGWLKGYFLTIGSTEITESDIARSYGFWHNFTRRFYNEDGIPLGYEPEFQGVYGLGSYGLVGRTVKQALEKNQVIRAYPRIHINI